MSDLHPYSAQDLEKMTNMITPPNNTKIRIEYNEAGQEEIVIPQPGGGIFRFFIGAFMLFWFGAWGVGWKSAAAELLGGTKGPQPFLIFWLGAWTVGGVFAVYFLYRIFRPSMPERMVLSYASLSYDSGIPPFQVSFSFGFSSQVDFWKKMFQKRTRTEFDRSSLKSLKLKEFASGNRLTIDQNNKRYDLAVGTSELEKEWLFKVLNSQYNS
jgi:hypothetical protein